MCNYFEINEVIFNMLYYRNMVKSTTNVAVSKSYTPFGPIINDVLELLTEMLKAGCFLILVHSAHLGAWLIYDFPIFAPISFCA